MVDDGYEDVVSIDISSVVIDTMIKKYSDRPQLKYLKMDVRDMKAFEDASFDAVIDKGTLDSILCGSNSRQYSTQMLEEVWRVLKDKGVYILITYGAPIYRLRLFKESCSWTTKLHVIDKSLTDQPLDTPKWELTKPLPLDADGSSVESAIGKNPDVHYIYVCIKVCGLMLLPALLSIVFFAKMMLFCFWITICPHSSTLIMQDLIFKLGLSFTCLCSSGKLSQDESSKMEADAA
jgi:SAM-dependent methyltransferase